MRLSGIGASFDAAMARFGPFEPCPVLAVAVSGGPDSMALALLARRWAARRRGRAVALVVDHGLRPGARAEARATRRRLAALGLESRLLVWRGTKPAAGIQEAARDARYALLEGWCARAGVLHLLTGHQRDDQAETVAMRRARGSGPDGLAGIPSVAERTHVRLLRPLLGVPRAALQDFLAARGVGWIDDPSNADPRFARTGHRAALADRGGAGRLVRDAARNARARAAAEAACARLLARHAAVYPQGYARISRRALARAPAAIARRALARLIGCIGGGVYPPRGGRLGDLHATLRRSGVFRGRTLGGCRIVSAGGSLLFVREVRGAARPEPAGSASWDGRFRLVGPRAVSASPTPLGEAGWAEVVRHSPASRATPVPAPARAALPAFRDRRGILAVPQIGYGRASRKAASLARIQVIFRSARPLCPAEFPVA